MGTRRPHATARLAPVIHIDDHRYWCNIGSVLDAEALALMALGYRKISYVELHCWRHGDIRGAVEEDEPAEVQRCPFCRTLCISKTLGRGFTRQPRIRWESYNRPASAAVTFLRDARGKIKGVKRAGRRLDFQPTQHHPLAVRRREGD